MFFPKGGQVLVVSEPVQTNPFVAAVNKLGFGPSDELFGNCEVGEFRPHLHLTFAALVNVWSMLGWLLVFFPSWRASHPLLTIAIAPHAPFLFQSVSKVPIWQFMLVALPRISLSDYSAFKLGKTYQSWRHMTLPRIPVLTPTLDSFIRIVRWFKQRKKLKYVAMAFAFGIVWYTSRKYFIVWVLIIPVSYLFSWQSMATWTVYKRHPAFVRRHWLFVSTYRPNKEQIFVAGLFGKSGPKVAIGAVFGKVMSLMKFYGIRAVIA